MSQYFVLHTPTRSPEEIAAWMTAEAVVGFAKANASGDWPAKCLKTWDPSAYGRVDYTFCLWEAGKPEDIQATLERSGVARYYTADIMQVNETDWAALAAG